jgi:hypothetical protein
METLWPITPALVAFVFKQVRIHEMASASPLNETRLLYSILLDDMFHKMMTCLHLRLSLGLCVYGLETVVSSLFNPEIQHVECPWSGHLL